MTSIAQERSSLARTVLQSLFLCFTASNVFAQDSVTPPELSVFAQSGGRPPETIYKIDWN